MQLSVHANGGTQRNLKKNLLCSVTVGLWCRGRNGLVILKWRKRLAWGVTHYEISELKMEKNVQNNFTNIHQKSAYKYATHTYKSI